MLKISEIANRIVMHERELKRITDSIDPRSLNEIQFHKFRISAFKRQERLRIALLPWANAGQILHGEYKRDWTDEELRIAETFGAHELLGK